MAMSEAPADTRMMAIVHGALQRDLARMRAALTAAPPPPPRQRAALGAHGAWLMDVLHAHHHAEDEGLWPLVRRRNPGAGALLDQMDADHRRIVPAMASFRAAALAYAGAAAGAAPDGEPAALLAALDALTEVLIPHLEREVREMMPVVSASITHAEWQQWDQSWNVKPKSLLQLGTEGHWLLDGIGEDGYQVVVQQVPAVPRFILLHGFRRRYRRQAAARWQPAAATVPARAGADAS